MANKKPVKSERSLLFEQRFSTQEDQFQFLKKYVNDVMKL